MFWNADLKLLLTVHVDDFKMAGPKDSLAKGWAKIAEAGLELEDAKPLERFLGCHHRRVDTSVKGVPVNAMIYDVRDFMGACVDSYLKLAGRSADSLAKVETPFLPAAGDAMPETADEDCGSAWSLASIACKVLMKILYGARVGRWDLLKIVSLLASRVTKWTPNCDRALHRLVSYIHCLLDTVQWCHVAKDLTLDAIG